MEGGEGGAGVKGMGGRSFRPPVSPPVTTNFYLVSGCSGVLVLVHAASTWGRCIIRYNAGGGGGVQLCCNGQAD